MPADYATHHAEKLNAETGNLHARIPPPAAVHPARRIGHRHNQHKLSGIGSQAAGTNTISMRRLGRCSRADDAIVGEERTGSHR
jgi:hypothetical protein